MLMLPPALTASIASLCLLGFCAGACAREDPEWLVRVGAYPLKPQESPHAQLEVGDGAAAAFEGTWMFAPQWGLELMAAAPVEHDLYLRGVGKAGSLQHAPVALTLQRRFLDPNGRVQAYAGAGVAYSAFFKERTFGPLDGVELGIDAAHGFTAQAGLDLALGSDWFISLGVRWFDLEPEAAIDGAGIGALELDPRTVGLALGRRLQ
jgi:outer membrane protein